MGINTIKKYAIICGELGFAVFAGFEVARTFIKKAGLKKIDNPVIKDIELEELDIPFDDEEA